MLMLVQAVILNGTSLLDSTMAIVHVAATPWRLASHSKVTTECQFTIWRAGATFQWGCHLLGRPSSRQHGILVDTGIDSIVQIFAKSDQFMFGSHTTIALYVQSLQSSPALQLHRRLANQAR